MDNVFSLNFSIKILVVFPRKWFLSFFLSFFFLQTKRKLFNKIFRLFYHFSLYQNFSLLIFPQHILYRLSNVKKIWKKVQFQTNFCGRWNWFWKPKGKKVKKVKIMKIKHNKKICWPIRNIKKKISKWIFMKYKFN